MCWCDYHLDVFYDKNQAGFVRGYEALCDQQQVRLRKRPEFSELESVGVAEGLADPSIVLRWERSQGQACVSACLRMCLRVRAISRIVANGGRGFLTNFSDLNQNRKLYYRVCNTQSWVLDELFGIFKGSENCTTYTHTQNTSKYSYRNTYYFEVLLFFPTKIQNFSYVAVYRALKSLCLPRYKYWCSFRNIKKKKCWKFLFRSSTFVEDALRLFAAQWYPFAAIVSSI